jgi:6-phosphogluconolactonase
MHIVVGSYAAADAPGIYGFEYDPGSGALTPRGSFAGIINPSFVIMHPNRRYLYAVSETNAGDGAPGAVWALALQREPWALHPLNNQPSGGDAPCHLALDRAGRWLLVSNYSSGSVGVLPVAGDGSLGPLAELVQHSGNGPNSERQAGPHAHSATWSPDERFVVVADLGSDALVVYAFDQIRGKLSQQQRVAARPGAGPRHATFHPNGQLLYVANELDSTVSVYGYNAATGHLREHQTLSTLATGAPSNTVADIHFDANRRRVYVSNRGDDSLAAFAVSADGRLGLLAVRPCGGATPRNFALVPGGHMALVAHQDGDSLAFVPLGGDEQAIGEPQAAAKVARPTCVQIVGSE